jgi:putative SOS response-associated peptidase YedK
MPKVEADCSAPASRDRGRFERAKDRQAFRRVPALAIDADELVTSGPQRKGERWKDGMLSCTILTSEASDGIRDLHTRMPVALTPQGFKARLAGEDPAVDPSLTTTVKVIPISPTTNSPKHNEPDCIEAC